MLGMADREGGRMFCGTRPTYGILAVLLVVSPGMKHFLYFVVRSTLIYSVS